MTLLFSTPAHASGGHNYAQFEETTYAGYTGLSVTRTDEPAITANDGCSAYYTGHVIYETQWVLDSTANNWLEFGTGHSCAGSVNYRYWGTGSQGVWYPMGEANIANGASHEFKITRGGDPTWVFKVDDISKGSISWDRGFQRVHTGVESYAPNGHMNAHNFTNLQEQHGGSTTWNDWSGRDNKLVEDPPMCGFWNSDKSIRAGEAASC